MYYSLFLRIYTLSIASNSVRQI